VCVAQNSDGLNDCEQVLSAQGSVTALCVDSSTGAIVAGVQKIIRLPLCHYIWGAVYPCRLVYLQACQFFWKPRYVSELKYGQVKFGEKAKSLRRGRKMSLALSC